MNKREFFSFFRCLICLIPRLWELYNLVFFALFFRCPIFPLCFDTSSTLPFFKVSYLSDLAADNQGTNAPRFFVLSLFFLCSFFVLSLFSPLVSLSLSALKSGHFLDSQPSACAWNKGNGRKRKACFTATVRVRVEQGHSYRGKK